MQIGYPRVLTHPRRSEEQMVIAIEQVNVTSWSHGA
jgi:hypothetical protein